MFTFRYRSPPSSPIYSNAKEVHPFVAALPADSFIVRQSPSVWLRRRNTFWKLCIVLHTGRECWLNDNRSAAEQCVAEVLSASPGSVWGMAKRLWKSLKNLHHRAWQWIAAVARKDGLVTGCGQGQSVGLFPNRNIEGLLPLTTVPFTQERKVGHNCELQELILVDLFPSAHLRRLQLGLFKSWAGIEKSNKTVPAEIFQVFWNVAESLQVNPQCLVIIFTGQRYIISDDY